MYIETHVPLLIFTEILTEIGKCLNQNKYHTGENKTNDELNFSSLC